MAHRSVVTLLVLSLFGFQHVAAAGDPVAENSVWPAGVTRFQEIRKGCDRLGGKELLDCFLLSAQKSGAPAQMISFIRRIGEPGIVRDFKKVGPVGIVFCTFPYRANENQACFLVNGSPDIVNVDDLSPLTPEFLSQDQTYAALLKKYPKAAVWIGDRDGTGFVSSSTPFPGGDIRVTVSFRLTEGCRACQEIGTVRIGFDFDAKGVFKGRVLLRAKPKDAVRPGASTAFPTH